MAKKNINIGTAANDSTGDPLRTAFSKVNDNFTELYTNLGGSNYRLVNNDLGTASGNINITSAGGYTTLNDDVTIDNDLTVTGGLSVGGALTFNGGITVPGPVNATTLFGNVQASYLSATNPTSLTSLTLTGNLNSTSTSGAGFVNLNVSNTTVASNFRSPNVNITGGNLSGVNISASTISGLTISAVQAISGTYIDNTVIGANVANTAVFTKMTTSNAQITGGNISGVNIGILSINSTPIGNSAPSTGAFTTVVTSGAGSATTGAGQLYLNGTTSNRIEWNNTGLGAPALTTRSAGTKLTVYPNVDSSGIDYGIGMEAGAMWFSVHDTTGSFKFYSNASTIAATLSGTGNLTVGGQHIGYHTGAIGANTANTGVFTSVTTSAGGQHIGYFNGAIGANAANTGVFTSVTTSAGGQVSGYLTGAIGANAANTGVFTSVTTSAGGQVSGYLTGAIGANTPNTGAFTTITATTLTGNVTGNLTGTASTATTAGTATYASTAGLANTSTTVVQPYQGNITGVGTLANLNVTPGNLVASNVYVNSNLYAYRDINVIGNLNFLNTSGTINLQRAFTFPNRTIANSYGTAGDVSGQMCWDNNYMYICKADYTGSGAVWVRANLNTF